MILKLYYVTLIVISNAKHNALIQCETIHVSFIEKFMKSVRYDSFVKLNKIKNETA